ncbi:MAG: helix-turn-helix domain-containing protein [Puniceicoccaceae bacterium]
MKTIEEFLNQLNISDSAGEPSLKSQRTRLYQEHLQGLQDGFRNGRADIRIPEASGRFDRSAPGHFHPTPEVFMQISGRTHFSCPAGDFNLSPGGICVMPHGIPHHETFYRDKAPYLTLIMMLWEEGISFHFGYSVRSGSIKCGTIDRYGLGSRQEIIQLLDLTSAHSDESRPADEFVFHLMAAFVNRLLASTRRPFAGQMDANILIHRCRDLIAIHQDDVKFNLRALAGLLDYHPDYLSRLFQRETGQTVTAYINRERINRAKFHLSGPLTINEIAWSCGYNHTSSFIRVLKQQTGLTPQAYRLAQP